MRILLIGGTRFIGRHVVESALAAGHDVTIFHRGKTGDDLFPDVEHRIGDRNSDLSALADGSWDATVDTCAYVPRQVQELADVLGDRAGHYQLVSSVSAYASPAPRGYREDAPLAELDDPTVEEVTDETYGGLKVLCERVAVERFGPRTVIVRPTYVVGPDDYTWRFPWWVARIARGGEVLAPGPADAPSQVIDVRDMAAWMVGLLERGESGAFHAVGPSSTFTWGEQLEAIASSVAPGGHDAALGGCALPARGSTRRHRAAAVARCRPGRADDDGRSRGRPGDRPDDPSAGRDRARHPRLDPHGRAAREVGHRRRRRGRPAREVAGSAAGVEHDAEAHLVGRALAPHDIARRLVGKPAGPCCAAPRRGCRSPAGCHQVAP